MALQRTPRPRFLKLQSGFRTAVPVQERAGTGRSLRSLGAPLNARPLGRGIAALAFVALAVACCGAPGYEGDGEAKGYGTGFEVHLGRIDAANPGSHSYRMRGLSRNDLIAGFRTPQRPIDAIVRLSLVNGHGQQVILEEAPLADWVWTYTYGPEPREYFVYRRGESRDIPIGEGSVRIEHVGMRPDGGWGTYFHPGVAESYELGIEVIRPSQTSALLKPVVKCAEVYSP